APDQRARRRGAGELRLLRRRRGLAPRPGDAARPVPHRAPASEAQTGAMVRKVLTPARLVLIGPPGAGKSTLTPALIERRGRARSATGARRGEEITAGSDLGRAAEAFVDRGALVPDGLMDRVLRPCLDETPAGRGFLLDGYPRNPHQAAALD